MPSAERITDCNAADHAAIVGIPVLKCSEAWPELLSQAAVFLVNVKICDVPRTVRESANWKDERRAEQIADLQRGVVLTVGECGTFDDARIRIARVTELLRENAEGKSAVQCLCS